MFFQKCQFFRLFLLLFQKKTETTESARVFAVSVVSVVMSTLIQFY